MILIKSIDALRQPIDFSMFADYCKYMTDVDEGLKLKNDIILLIEIKKDTFNHTKEKVCNSAQWRFLQELANNRSNIYLIYATHNQDIDANTPIKSNECEVQYIECCGKKIDLDCSNNLLEVVKYFALKQNIEEKIKYHIIVKYPNYTLEHAIRQPSGPKWTLPYYSPISCDFNSKEEALRYIKTRFKTIIKGKRINKDNTYILIQKDENNNDLIIEKFSSN